MHNRQGLSIKMIWEALKDWRLWPIYCLGLIHQRMCTKKNTVFLCLIQLDCSVPVGPPQTYLTLSLRALGFNTTQTSLLTIPSIVLGMITLLGASYFSEIVNCRVAATIILQLWALPLLIALYTFDRHTSQWAYFAVVSLIAAFPYIHPIQVAWTSRNSNSVRTRTVSASVYNMFVQTGAIVYVGSFRRLQLQCTDNDNFKANIYRADDKPLCKLFLFPLNTHFLTFFP